MKIEKLHDAPALVHEEEAVAVAVDVVVVAAPEAVAV